VERCDSAFDGFRIGTFDGGESGEGEALMLGVRLEGCVKSEPGVARRTDFGGEGKQIETCEKQYGSHGLPYAGMLPKCCSSPAGCPSRVISRKQCISFHAPCANTGPA